MRIPYRRTYLSISLMILALGGLYAASVYNYSLFLSLASLFSITIALGIFILVWTSRNHLDNNYLLFIGIAYLFIGGLQTAHTLALEAVYGYGNNTAEHLWVVTHYVESLTFLAAPLFIGHNLRPRSIFLSYAIITPVLLTIVILWNVTTAVGAGDSSRTLFTDTSQYIIAMIFASAVLLLLQKRQHFNAGVLRLLVAAMTITAGVGVVSAIVKTGDEAMNMAGHLAQLVALGCIFQAVVDAGLTRPYQLILSDLSQNREALRHERDTAQKYLDVAGVMFVAIDTSGKVTLINKRGCEVLGYSEKEIVGKDWFDNFLPPRLREDVKSVAWRLLRGEIDVTEYYENPVLTKSGEERIIAWHNVLLKDESGNITGHLSSGEDITQRKHAERALRESEEELRRMFSSVTDGILVTNLNGIITDANEKAVRMYGCNTPKELIGANSLKLVEPTDLPRVMADMKDVLEKGIGENTGIEYVVTRKDGSSFPSEASTSVLKDASGSPAGFISVIRDVTEQKQAEEKLQESEARYRALFETKLDGTMVIDETIKIVLANQAVADMFGFDSIGELYEINLLDYIMPELKEWVIELIAVGLFQEDRRGLYEIQCMKKNGDEIWVSVTGVRTEYNGKPIGIISVRDITDRKRMAEAIAKSAQRYRSLFENMPVGFVYAKIITDENDNPVDALCLEVNDAVEKLFVIKKELLIGKRFSEIMPTLTESNPDLFEVVGEVAATGKSVRFEDYFEPLGKWVSSSIYSPEKGYFTALFEDITEHKQAEEIFRTVSLGSPAGMYIVQDGKFVFANPRFLMNEGISEDVLLGTHSLDRVHPEDREMVRQNAIAMLKGERTTPYEYRVVNDKGEISAWLSETVVSIQYQGKRAVLGNVVDITEQKQAEEIFQTVSLSSPASIYIAQDGKFVFANPRLLNRIGYTEEGISNIEPQGLVHPEDREIARQGAIDMLKGKRTTPYEYRVFAGTGEMLWVTETVASIQYRGKRAVLGSLLDITERKQMEEALKQSEHMYSTLVQKGSDGIVIIQDELLKFANPKILEIAGYSLDEIINKPFAEFVAPADREMVTDSYSRRIKKQEAPDRYEALITTKDGRSVPVEISASVIEFEGSPAIMAILRDITERKEAEEALRESEEKLRLMFESIADGITITDLEARIVEINTAVVRMHGFASVDEIIGRSAFDLIAENDHARALDNLKKTLEEGNSGTIEYSLTRKDGSTFPGELDATLMKDPDGNAVGFVAITNDITERKETENLLKDILMNSPVSTYILQDDEIQLVNPAFCQNTGYTEDELLAIDPSKLIHQDDVELVEKKMIERLGGKPTEPFEFRSINKDGSIQWVLMSVALIQYHGKPAMLAAPLNITERKEAERRIIAGRHRFRDLVELLPLGVWEMDRNLKTTFINRYIIEAIGISEEELANNNTTLGSRSESFIPEDRERIKENCQRILSGEQLGPTEYTILRRDGTTFPAMIYSAPIIREGETAGLRSVVIDVTEQKQAQEIFRTMSLRSPVGMYIVQDGKFVFVNPQFTSDLSVTEERILGARAMSRVQSEDREAARQNAIAMLKGERSAPYEYRVTNRAGETKWFMETVAPIQYQGKRAVLGSVLDITEHRRAEEALAQSKERYQDLFDNTSDLIQSVTADGQFIYVNNAWQKVLGYSKDEIANLKVWDVIHPDSLPHCKEVFQRVMSNETVKDVETVFVAKDGRLVLVEGNVQCYFDNGKPFGTQGIFRDITERKQNEERLRETRRRFRDLVNLLPLSVTEIDTTGNITFANKKAIDESGYTEEELRAAPRSPLDSFIPEDRERVKANIQRLFNGESLGRVEYTHQRRDGSTYPVVTYSAPIIQDGKAAGLRTVTIDVSEQKKAEQEIAKKNRELEEANAQLQEVDRLKSIFLSSMSHELRTPLNSIIGFTSLILDGMTGDINEEQREQLTLVKSSSNHLLSLINDVLDISKIEAGKVELSLEKFMLREVISEVIEILTPAAQKKGIELISETKKDLQLYNDRRRFKQVLINLASNAVKFTEQGSVRITAGLHKEKGQTQADSLEVHVIDTGIGIEKEDIDKLFAPFQQVDGSLTRRFEGTGLGLHLCKKILNMLGGDIWVKSRYGKGSDFGFILPLKYRGDENDEENTGSR